MLERIGPEAVEDVLGQVQGLIVGEDHGEEGMPGAFAGAVAAGGAVPAVEGDGAGAGAAPAEPEPAREEPPVQEPEGEHDEDEEEPTGIQRILRNVLGRIWNGVVGVAGDTSSDEEDAVEVGEQGRARMRVEGDSDDVD
ncbi:hypothetical protein C0993_006829 [Termitomyces sp. T159_Od127]|nr:hypothetical protein C0993_006829 [Termitomyces sp. T159_Od127]